MSLEIHPTSVQSIFLPVRQEHPTTGAVVLSALGVEVAMPAVGAAASVWVACTWATGTQLIGDARYYNVVVTTSGFTFANGSEYQPWVRLGGASGVILKAGGTIKATNT